MEKTDEQINEIIILIIKEYFELKLSQQKKKMPDLGEEAKLAGQDDRSGYRCGQSSNCTKLKAEFYSDLLKSDNGDEEGKSAFPNSSYPNAPLYRKVGREIGNWITTKQCPFTSRISMPLLNEEISKEKRARLCNECENVLDDIRTAIKGRNHPVDGCTVVDGNDIKGDLVKLDYDKNEESKIKYFVWKLLDTLGKRGLMHLLGIRETAGSIIKAPVNASKLMQSFMASQNEKSKLTVGGRALSKHFHRCQSEWWGDCKGTEAEKNEHALRILTRIMNDCIWINIHLLPHDLEVIEVR